MYGAMNEVQLVFICVAVLGIVAMYYAFKRM